MMSNKPSPAICHRAFDEEAASGHPPHYQAANATESGRLMATVRYDPPRRNWAEIAVENRA